MPELPEVETIVRDLGKRIRGAVIEKVEIFDGRVVRQKSFSEFKRRLQWRKIHEITRRGKAIILTLTACEPGDAKNTCDYLIVQLMMTGQLIYANDPSPGRDTKLRLTLGESKYLFYNDYRTFGRLEITDNLQAVTYLMKLGPEPLSSRFSKECLKAKLRLRKMPIKPLLLNHGFVAGIGNIYASEILFVSGISPLKPAKDLQEEEIRQLHKAIKSVLKEAIKYRGTSMNTYRDLSGKKGSFINRVKVYGRENEQCSKCQALVLRVVQSGRSTFYCPQCQH